MHTPESLFYSHEHLWTKPLANGIWEAGITDYAQDLLGDIVFVDTPAIGQQLHAGASCGLVESVKTGSDLYAPANGVVVEINQSLSNTPESINDDPYKAWIFRYKPEDEQLEFQLLSAEAYKKSISDL
ncbi:MAG: glycine cleavage system protein GcvH [Betaproteobacteria bacterium]|nr:glycine cleavage system protein GcvH [Betaproteobacteria bacterium]